MQTKGKSHVWPLGVFCVAYAAFLVFFCFELWFFDQHSRNIHKYADCRCVWKTGRYGVIQLASQRVTGVAHWRQLAAPPPPPPQPGWGLACLQEHSPICPLHSPTLLLGPIAFAFEPPVRLHCRLLSTASDPAVCSGLTLMSSIMDQVPGKFLCIWFPIFPIFNKEVLGTTFYLKIPSIINFMQRK